MNSTYKQEIKQKSRLEIWSHAIDSLTSRRNEVRILKKGYLQNLTKYVEEKSNCSLREDDINDFLSYLELSYGERKPEELKVAFFCGPEPENDVETLLKFGIRLENMFAFECNKSDFNKAVKALQGKYPQLKIFNGTIETYSKLHHTIFDIVYLDFTNSLPSCFPTICSIIDNNMLASVSVLAINTTFPDANEDVIDFLTNYFYYTSKFERCILAGNENYEDITPAFGRFEGIFAEGLDEPVLLKEHIQKHFEEAYSAFQSDIVNGYLNITKPIYSILSQSITRKRLFKDDKIKDLLAYEKAYKQLEYDSFVDDCPLFSMKFHTSNNDVLRPLFENKEDGRLYSRIQSLKLWELLVNSHYIHQYDMTDQPLGEDEEGNPIYEKIDIPSYLAEPLEQSLSVVEDAIKPRAGNVMFCDLPMIHLWYEMIVNTMGYPYHVNVFNHKRHSYTAKTRKMCVDIFTLDQCRGLYDWLPMIEYQHNYVADFDKQMIIRMCIDSIAKNSLGTLPHQYFGSAVIGAYEYDWAEFADFPKRETIE